MFDPLSQRYENEMALMSPSPSGEPPNRLAAECPYLHSKSLATAPHCREAAGWRRTRVEQPVAVLGQDPSRPLGRMFCFLANVWYGVRLATVL